MPGATTTTIPAPPTTATPRWQQRMQDLADLLVTSPRVTYAEIHADLGCNHAQARAAIRRLREHLGRTERVTLVQRYDASVGTNVYYLSMDEVDVLAYKAFRIGRMIAEARAVKAILDAEVRAISGRTTRGRQARYLQRHHDVQLADMVDELTEVHDRMAVLAAATP